MRLKTSHQSDLDKINGNSIGTATMADAHIRTLTWRQAILGYRSMIFVIFCLTLLTCDHIFRAKCRCDRLLGGAMG